VAYLSEAQRDACTKRILEAAREKSHPLHIAQAIRPDYAYWAECYYALLTCFLTAGYSIKPFCEYDPTQADRTLFLRHDVHWRDIPGALAMMDMERKLGIRSTYYVMWEYRQWDRNHRDDYLLLKKFGGDDFEYGLHECALDEYLFRHYLDGGDDPEQTRNAAEKILDEADLANAQASDFFEADENGVFRLRSVEALPGKRLQQWVSGALTILAERIESFQLQFGACNTIHAHGGYSWSLLRRYLNLPGNYHFFQRFHELPMAHPVMIGQLFRACERNWLNELGVKHFAYDVIYRHCAQQPKCLDYHDGKDQTSRHQIERWLAAQRDGNAAFMNLHPWLWTTENFKGLADQVIDHATQSDCGVKPGPPRYGIYRTGLSQKGWAYFCERYGDDWLEDNHARTAFGYSIGNFDNRAQRVVGALAEYNRLDVLDGGRVIDLGGGVGTISAYLAANYSVQHLHVMDIDPQAIEFQRDFYHRIGWTHGEVEVNDFANWQAPSHPADLIVSYGAFEFMPKRREIRWIFDQVGHALRPGGVFLVNVWNHHYPEQGYSRARYVQHLPTQRLRLAAARWQGKSPNPHFRSLSHRRWERELRLAGFDDVRIWFCRNTTKGLEFTDVHRSNRGKQTHVWVLATKR